MPEKMIALEEVPAVSDALAQWFTSQDLSPSSAGLVMADLTARILVAKARSPKELREGLKIYISLLITGVSGAIDDA